MSQHFAVHSRTGEQTGLSAHAASTHKCLSDAQKALKTLQKQYPHRHFFICPTAMANPKK